MNADKIVNFTISMAILFIVVGGLFRSCEEGETRAKKLYEHCISDGKPDYECTHITNYQP